MLGFGAGDVINEARFLTSLSQFADVYYNGTLFKPTEPDYGLSGDQVVIPEGGYDLYYVRANSEAFKQLPHPKVAMAYPYDAEVFQCADALVVTTEAWKRGLKPYDPANNVYSSWMTSWYGDKIVEPKHVINIKQAIDPDFLAEPEEHEILEARMRLALSDAIGFFGRIQDNTFPAILLEAYKAVIEEYPQIKFVVGGTIRMQLDRTILRLPRLSHDKMPALLTACTATATDEGNDSMFLGSGKVLDSMARGVPVIAFKSPSRVEQLGEDYPLYYETVAECRQRIREAVLDESVRAEAKQHLVERRQLFLPEARARDLRDQILALISRHACRVD